MSSVFQGSDDESDLFIVSGDTVISENSPFPCNRSPRHTNGIATEEMNQSFFEQMPVQKATPFPETIRGGLRERSALIRQGLPAIEIHGDIESVNPPERASSQPALHRGAAEIQKLDPVSPDQRTVVEDLCVMSRRKSIDRPQFVDHAFDDQIQTIYLRKTAEGDLNGSLSMNFAKPFRPKSRCKIVFIHGFLTKPPQFILTLVSAAHHHLVNLIKLLIAQSPLPNGMNDRHTKSNFNEPDSRGKRDLKNAKSHFQFPSFPCPHSLVPFSFLFLPVLTHAAPPRAVLDESHRVFLREHCAACHNADKQKGKVRLDDIPFVLDDIPTADLWQKVLNSVNSGEMPPEDEPQPADEAKAAFLEALSGTLVTARDQLADSGGEIAMRRLNRREYEKTIRDLLGVEINARELPADSGAGTFDTVGSSLFMSSDQFEQYLALGRQAVDEHFARFVAPVPEKEWKLRIEVEGTNQRIIKGLQERSDARERYLQWTAAVDTAAAKPENEELADRIRAEKKGDPRHLHTQWEKIQGAPSPTDFGFTDAIHAEQMGRRDWDHFVPHHRAYVEHPLAKSGSFLTIDDAYVNSRQIFQLPADWPAGDYVLRVRIAAMDGIPRERRFVEFGPQDPSGVCTVSSTHEVTGTADQPQVLEIPLKLTESKNRLFMFRERGSHESDASASRLFAEARQRNGIGPELALWLDWIEVEKAGVAKPFAKTIRQRREVELHANAMVGGTYNGYFKGGHEAAKKLLETGQPQKGIADEQEAKFRVRVFEEHGPSFERYLNDPLTKTGAYLTIYNVHTEELITLPPDQPSGWLKTKHEVEQAEPGEYVLRFRIGAVKGTPEERHFAELGSRQGGPDDFTLMETFQITGTTEVPQTIELPVSISAGGPRSFVLREKRDVKLDFDTYQAARKETKVGPPPALWIDWVEWEGPVRNPSTNTLTKTQRIEPESRRADVERGHLRFKYLNEQYAKWQAAGGDEKRLKEFDFIDKSHAEAGKTIWEANSRWFQQYLDRPLSRTGLYLDNAVQETCEHAIDLPTDLATGDYVMRVKIGRVVGMPEERAFLSFVEASPIDKDDRSFLANKQITAPIDAAEVVELPFKIRPGGPRKFVLMEKRPLKKETISLPGRTRQIEDPKQRDPVLWIDWIEWEGPLGGANSQNRIPPLLSSSETNPRAVLERFAARAMRGKTPSATYLDKLAALHDARVKAGEPFDLAIREPLSAILASPGFLYIQEIGTKDRGKGEDPSHSYVPIPLSPPELASRLSYFLWSAPPDEALLAADLTKPDVLAREVDRLIASPKADDFVSGFVHQWLHLDRLDFFQFDTKQFRDFDESAKAAARREVYETFAHLLRNGGSLSRLLKSDEVHVNGLLATYYGIEGVSGDAFRPVKVPPGSPRGGLLGMAAVLAMGSNGERTSPVERGAWVLRYLLHNPPPPAPPNVPQLDRLDGKPVSPRERLFAHQEEAQCAQCHRKIDPIGFGLENFNAAGKWREIDYDPKTKKEWPIDPAGAFHNGPAFKDYFELRDLVAARSDDFARGFTEALIEYGLGRPYGFTDDALAADIVARAKEEDFVVREFILSLVASGTFGKK